MKKLVSILGVCSAFVLTACDSNAGAKNGDTVIIDFAGFDNGIQFDGGTAVNVPLVLGSGQFIPGFEDQLIGAKVGEKRDVNVTFPENYHATQLAGHPVVFKVTVKDIKSK